MAPWLLTEVMHTTRSDLATTWRRAEGAGPQMPAMKQAAAAHFFHHLAVGGFHALQAAHHRHPPAPQGAIKPVGAIPGRLGHGQGRLVLKGVQGAGGGLPDLALAGQAAPYRQLPAKLLKVLFFLPQLLAQRLDLPLEVTLGLGG